MPILTCNDEHITYPISVEEATEGKCLMCGGTNIIITEV
jgi:hypothetical protein